MCVVCFGLVGLGFGLVVRTCVFILVNVFCLVWFIFCLHLWLIDFVG